MRLGIIAACALILWTQPARLASGLTPIAKATLAAAQHCEQPRPVEPDVKAPGSSYQDDGMPPARFRGNTAVILQTLTPAEVEKKCDDGPPTCGYVTLACTVVIQGKHDHTALMIMPNPCSSPDDPYAVLLCHELGHANGWPDSHGQ